MENIFADHSLYISEIHKIFSWENFTLYNTINGKYALSVWYIVYMGKQQTGACIK